VVHPSIGPIVSTKCPTKILNSDHISSLPVNGPRAALLGAASDAFKTAIRLSPCPIFVANRFEYGRSNGSKSVRDGKAFARGRSTRFRQRQNAARCWKMEKATALMIQTQVKASTSQTGAQMPSGPAYGGQHRSDVLWLPFGWVVQKMALRVSRSQ